VNTLLSTLTLPGWLRWLLPVDGVEPADRGGVVVEEETAWLERVANGDDSALQHLFDKWKRPLLSFFYRALGSHADAEDFTLEVFVRLHRAAAGYRPTAKFSTYVFHIAHNLVRNEYRRRHRKPADAVPPDIFDTLDVAAPESAQRLLELEEVLQRALGRLPEKQRTALLLVLQQQMDYPAAAAALDMTENAFRVLVHRARQSLKSEMEAQP
jgi:RNA polymerase sigma-70 factor (ECF subfamily)